MDLCLCLFYDELQGILTTMFANLRGRLIGVIVKITIKVQDLLLPTPNWASPDLLAKGENLKDRFREVISDPVNF